MKVWNIALALLACLGSMSADATVTIDDKYVVGDQGVLFDDATNLDWARGFVSGSAFLGPVGPSEGFRLASASEVDMLFNDVGLTPRFGSVVLNNPAVGPPDFGNANLHAFNILWNDWHPGGDNSRSGPVGGNSQVFITESSGLRPLPTGEIPFRYGLLATSFRGMVSPNVLSWGAQADAGISAPPELRSMSAGLAHVRDHVQVIPEPDTYLMMLTGLVALSGVVRRRGFLPGR